MSRSAENVTRRSAADGTWWQFTWPERGADERARLRRRAIKANGRKKTRPACFANLFERATAAPAIEPTEGGSRCTEVQEKGHCTYTYKHIYWKRKCRSNDERVPTCRRRSSHRGQFNRSRHLLPNQINTQRIPTWPEMSSSAKEPCTTKSIHHEQNEPVYLAVAAHGNLSIWQFFTYEKIRAAAERACAASPLFITCWFRSAE